MKMSHVIILVAMVSLSSCTTNQQNAITKKDVSSSFQPKPLDDEWNKWLVGEWRVVSGESSVTDESGRVSTIDLDEQVAAR